jgi:hypothetical protein
MPKKQCLAAHLREMDASPVPNGSNTVALEREDFWRVGWLAHGPLRDRCPRAAPNPS